MRSAADVDVSADAASASLSLTRRAAKRTLMLVANLPGTPVASPASVCIPDDDWTVVMTTEDAAFGGVAKNSPVLRSRAGDVTLTFHVPSAAILEPASRSTR
jgi:hypothetical protein